MVRNTSMSSILSEVQWGIGKLYPVIMRIWKPTI